MAAFRIENTYKLLWKFTYCTRYRDSLIKLGFQLFVSCPLRSHTFSFDRYLTEIFQMYRPISSRHPAAFQRRHGDCTIPRKHHHLVLYNNIEDYETHKLFFLYSSVWQRHENRQTSKTQYVTFLTQHSLHGHEVVTSKTS